MFFFFNVTFKKVPKVQKFNFLGLEKLPKTTVKSEVKPNLNQTTVEMFVNNPVSIFSSIYETKSYTIFVCDIFGFNLGDRFRPTLIFFD